MNTITGIPVDEFKKVGYSNADIEFMLESSAYYRKKWSAQTSQSTVLQTLHEPIVDIACNALETGLAVAIAKCRNLTKAPKGFGFVK